MSFRIFTLQLFGKLKPVEKIETERARLEKNYQAFLEAEKSEKLKKFQELESWVTSDGFRRRKQEIEAQVFKGSEEYNQLKELETLKKSAAIRRYFTVSGSAELKRFEAIHASEKLKEYYALKEFTENGEFTNLKREAEGQRFSGSAEEKRLHEFEQLQKNKALKAFLALQHSAELKKHEQFAASEKLRRFLELKNTAVHEKPLRKEFEQLKRDPEIKSYFRFENSRELKYYHEMKGNHLPERFGELQQETSSEAFGRRVAFLKDKKKFEKSEAWQKYLRYKTLLADADLKFYLKYKNSALYRNYLDVKDSFQLQRYNELLQLTASEAFLKRKAYLEDSKKWEKSEEYASLQNYQQLKKDPQVELYYKYCKSSEFDFLKTWEVTFFDGFQGSKTDDGKWIANTYWADRLLGEPFSQPGDLQGYSGGKNTVVRNGNLTIEVRREKRMGKRWQLPAGLVPTEFAYSSDTLSTAKSFSQREGIFEAKIRFAPVKEVVSSCHLLGEKVSPQVTLLEMGAKNRAGIHSFNNGQAAFSGVDLSGLKSDRFYIFRLEWEGSQLRWKINDCLVHEQTVAGFDEPAHLNLTSLVVKEVPSSKLPAAFEVAWIKCYRKS